MTQTEANNQTMNRALGGARGPLLLYNLAFPFALICMLPGLIIRLLRRGNYRQNFWQRFGFYSSVVRERLAANPHIWIQSISVGETMIALKLAKQMKQREPNLRVVLSITTSTGFAVARDAAIDWIEVIYNPIDYPWAVNRALDLIAPRQLIVIEGMWPNLVAGARRRGACISMIARLSPRSEARFRKFRALTGPVFRLFDIIFVQEPEDKARWESLGALPSQIRCVGAIKFDMETTGVSREVEFRELLLSMGVKPDAPILLAGSTFAGEEEILARLVRQLRPQFPGLFLILVPRHVERVTEIVDQLKPLGLSIVLRTELPFTNPERRADCLIVNTTGELRDWYHVASVVFIGKSLTASGGQNPVEAAIAGKPVLFGPHMENFRAVVQMLLAHQAAIQVRDAEELETQIRCLLSDLAARKRIAASAAAAVETHQGATGRTADILIDF